MKISKQCFKGINTQSNYKGEELDFIKMKNLCSLKDIIKRLQRQAIEEKILAISHEVCIQSTKRTPSN